MENVEPGIFPRHMTVLGGHLEVEGLTGGQDKL